MLSALFLIASAQAQVPIEVPTGPVFTSQERVGGAFGLGLAIGAPTGLHGRLWLSQFSALQFSVGGDNGVQRSISTSLDYIVRLHSFQQTDGEYTIPIYVGGGARFETEIWGDLELSFGPRAVGGIAVFVKDMPLDFFFEIAPAIYLVENAGWSIDGQIGAHYYF
jgi:hypothetical protein